ncbi:MAG: CAP domain-containing protein [Paracoccus sp. (in: a-proteobacteria)]|uniref:CAP domain-containing protein n=1 Tax=Paracoccus sp. TaxID=267 RepID=UPI0026DF03A9|nr:CAP domain-containing protein [Paracoccus sp. (in: a-proteobacteria)]MDO5620781.1 CAP domain-containing protein [Paracoccus sp. (in: a-proteobacteria)]
MKSGAIPAAFFLMATLILTALPAHASRQLTCPTPAPSAVNALVQTTNQMREQAGLPRLTLDQGLNAAAQRHACDLARRNVVSHTDSRGRTPMKRLRAGGYRACFSAENVAWGTDQPLTTVAAWRESPDHRVNQESPLATRMGFGVAHGPGGYLYWVGLYAAPCRS